MKRSSFCGTPFFYFFCALVWEVLGFCIQTRGFGGKRSAWRGGSHRLTLSPLPCLAGWLMGWYSEIPPPGVQGGSSEPYKRHPRVELVLSYFSLCWSGIRGWSLQIRQIHWCWLMWRLALDGLYLRCLICRFHWLVGSDCFFLVGVVVSPNCLGFGGFEYDHVSLRLTTLLLTAIGTRASTSILSRSITLLFSFLLLPFLPIFPESAKPSLLMPCGRKVLFFRAFLIVFNGERNGRLSSFTWP